VDSFSDLEEIPARRLPHKFFLLVEFLAVSVNLWMMAGQVLGGFVYENIWIDYILRGYVVILCSLMVLAELEITGLARTNMLLHNFIPRGITYGFISVIGIHENETATEVRSGWEGYGALSDIVRAVAWNMLGLAVLYFVMGITCMQYVLDKYRTDYQHRLERAKAREAYRKAHPELMRKEEEEAKKKTEEDDIEAQTPPVKPDWNYDALDKEKNNKDEMKTATKKLDAKKKAMDSTHEEEETIHLKPIEDTKASKSKKVEVTKKEERKVEPEIKIEKTAKRESTDDADPDWAKEEVTPTKVKEEKKKEIKDEKDAVMKDDDPEIVSNTKMDIV